MLACRRLDRRHELIRTPGARKAGNSRRIELRVDVIEDDRA